MKAFLFTTDALLAFFLVMVILSVMIMSRQPLPDLNNEILFQMTQDAIEVCNLKAELSKSCVKKLMNHVGVSVAFDEDCETGISFSRKKIDGSFNLLVCHKQ
ncbi:hypothetical protein DRN74_01835 [Candidatus Micrarchaeota archaeon]|nr:MAG: hypothetical protein DRN74_01835 [Candidatus Micrarchaeota archaeon]